MPGGQEYYQACLDYHLGTHLTPSEIHSLGYREVDRLEGLMRKVRNLWLDIFSFAYKESNSLTKKEQIPKVCLFELFEKYVISDHATVWIYRENIRIPPILANEKPPTRQKGKRLQIFFVRNT